jgi:AcrR family transcriptional regulator
MGAKTERRHAQGDESRERILDATIEIASQRGYQGTSIAQVSKQSGLPASSIYWHFKDKDDLFAAVIARSFEQWLSQTSQLATPAPGQSLRDHFKANLRAQAKDLTNNPEFLRLGLMLSLEEHPNEPSARQMFLQVRKKALDALINSFHEAFRAAKGKPDLPAARRAAILVMAAADGLFIAAQIDPKLDLGKEFELLADLIGTLFES